MTEAVYPTAESTRDRNGETALQWADRTYYPSFPGLHVCGADDEQNRAFTVLDISAGTDAAARAMFEAAKAECEVGQGEHDVIVDLNLRSGLEDDFGTTRQLLPRLEQTARAALAQFANTRPDGEGKSHD